jgi:hypothetical protein
MENASKMIQEMQKQTCFKNDHRFQTNGCDAGHGAKVILSFAAT